MASVRAATLLPGRGLGVAVFANAEGNSPDSLSKAIIDHLIDAPTVDWIGIQKTADAAKTQALLKTADASLDNPPAGSP